jgi:hypothetical protein
VGVDLRTNLCQYEIPGVLTRPLLQRRPPET